MRATSGFVSFLAFLCLTIAAAVSDEQTSTPSLDTLQKRDIICSPGAGRERIVLNDCYLALGKTPYQPGNDFDLDRAAAHERAKFELGEFGLFSLPQTFEHGTCIIYVDLPQNRRSVSSSWAEVERYIIDLIHECVIRKRGRGGKSDAGGFSISLFKAFVPDASTS